MSADFWAGYISGAIGILVGNPLDIIKTKLQAGSNASTGIDAATSRNRSIAQPVSSTLGETIAAPSTTSTASPTAQIQARPTAQTGLQNLARGAAAPILGYGALNALLFTTYNRSLSLLETGALSANPPTNASGLNIYAAGALGGLATFVVSAPTELVKCRAQISRDSSLDVARELWRTGGLRGIYLGGGITSVRDAVGYGFYFLSYELSKSALTRPDETSQQEALKVLFCGGLAGVVTWASIFPLDVVKTRLQTWDLVTAARSIGAKSSSSSSNNNHMTSSTTTSSVLESRPLLSRGSALSVATSTSRPSSYTIAKHAWQTEGAGVFFRGLGVCSLRAFIVNAVQWAVYEWTMKVLAPPNP